MKKIQQVIRYSVCMTLIMATFPVPALLLAEENLLKNEQSLDNNHDSETQPILEDELELSEEEGMDIPEDDSKDEEQLNVSDVDILKENQNKHDSDHPNDSQEQTVTVTERGTLIDSGKLEAGDWMFYSNGLLYFDGIVDKSDLDNWANYANEIKHIEIGHADLLGDWSSSFSRYKNLETFKMGETYLNNVTKMDYMFADLRKLKSVSFGWTEPFYKSKNVTSMVRVFGGTSSLVDLDIQSLDTRNVKNMNGMFYDSRSLKSLDLSHFDTSNVTNMAYMFARTSRLENLDLSNFNTNKVAVMTSMFELMSSLKTLDLSSFNTASVLDMSHMFASSFYLENLILGNTFYTDNVFKMDSMFYDTASLKTLDLSNFNTSKVASMKTMFAHAISLETLDLSSFDTRALLADGMDSMFVELSNLKELHLGSNVKFIGNPSLDSLPASHYWKGSLESNLLTSGELINYHNQLNKNNSYFLVSGVRLMFDTVGGSYVPDSLTSVGETWKEPITPTKKGYIFSGWYLDKEYTTPFDFNTVAKEDTIIYAKWVEEYLVQIPAKISLNSAQSVSLSATNNGEKDLNINLNQKNNELDNAQNLQLKNKSNPEITTFTRLDWEPMTSFKWNVLSINSDGTERTKEANITFSKPQDAQAGSYDGILTFEITYQ